MKRKIMMIILVAIVTAGTVEASFGYKLNGWRLREYLCQFGLGWNCQWEEKCHWRPCGKSG